MMMINILGFYPERLGRLNRRQDQSFVLGQIVYDRRTGEQQCVKIMSWIDFQHFIYILHEGYTFFKIKII